MSKVLISFLGTGPVGKASENGYRAYLKTKYTFKEGDSYETSFFAMALKQHYNIDKMILVGTPKSMWEEVYASVTNGSVDDVYMELAEYCPKVTMESPMDYIPRKDELEKAIGNDSKVILVNYGIKPDDMEENSKIILSVERFLNSNDEVYVDITHSFRSLPLMLMNTLIYLKNASRLNLKIQSVSYGMLEARNEMSSIYGDAFAPVVNLDSVMNMNEWISAASIFKNTADAYWLAELMKLANGATSSDVDVANKLVAFSDVMNMNYVAAVTDQVHVLKKLSFEGVSEYAKMIAVPVIKELVKNFGDVNSHAEMAYRIAEYQLKKKKYSSAAICATEAFVLNVCEKTNLLMNNSTGKNDKNAKQKAQDIIFGNEKGASKKEISLFRDSFADERTRRNFQDSYKKINAVRKEIAHSISGNRPVATMVATIESSIKFLRENIFINK